MHPAILSLDSRMPTFIVIIEMFGRNSRRALRAPELVGNNLLAFFLGQELTNENARVPGRFDAPWPNTLHIVYIAVSSHIRCQNSSVTDTSNSYVVLPENSYHTQSSRQPFIMMM